MPRDDPGPARGQRRQAVILTALPVEYKAVRAHLSDLSEEVDHHGAIYEEGTFRGTQGDWQVAIGMAGAGNVPAALHVSWAIERYKPSVVLFVGIAGGLKNVEIGDVVAATKVYGYDSGKAEAQFKPRPDVHRSAFALEQRALQLVVRGQWQDRILGGKPARRPDAFVKPIAAGEKVVASTESETHKLLKQTYGDALAVEMEGWGFLRGAWPAPEVSAMVVRGISDLLEGKDKAEKGGSQELASRHAAAFAFQLLSEFGLLQRQEEVRPPIWNVPHERNINFTGREAILQQLHESLSAGEAAALTQTQAIHGLGGVGKTQIAVEYAYRHRDEYDVVWWLRCEEAATLAADYAALARELGLPEAGAREQELAIAAVKRWLEGRAGWLLVFDNADKADNVRAYLSQGTSGAVLITSRNPAWGEVARPIQVRTWPRKRSVEYLLKRTDRDDAAGAGAVAEALGDLPLALAQAAAYIEQTGMSFAAYADLFETQQAALLEKGEPGADYPSKVATTWELSFQKVRKQPGAAELLNLCAFLAPEDIPQDVLVEGAEHVPEPLRAVLLDPLALQDAVGALRRYSLLEVAGESWSVHRLLQLVTREQMGEERRRTWATAAVSLVGTAFPYDSDDVRTWRECARLLPHALAAARQAEELGVAPDSAGRALNQLGLYLLGRAQFEEAKRAYERAVRLGESSLGPDHPMVATRVNNLGMVLRDLGDLAGARAHFERALGIHEAAYGRDHPMVATMANNLGGVLRELGDLAGARAHYERALGIDEAAYGPDHPNVATDVNNLGGVLRDLGDLAGARALYERALALCLRFYGDDHWKTQSVRRSLKALDEEQ